MAMMNHPPWDNSTRGGSALSQRKLLSESYNGHPQSWLHTSIWSGSERGDLLSSGDSEVSEDEQDSPPPANWTTEKPLEHEKRKKLIGTCE